MLGRRIIPRIALALVLGLAGCGLALSAPVGAQDQSRPEPLLSLIVTWLAANFGLPANHDHPKVERVPAKEIAALRFGSAGLIGQREVVAVYHDKRRTIYLPDQWTGKTPAELSVLVHEMVHHLQSLGGQTYLCPEAREAPAYAAQEKWLGLFGRSLTGEFGIDALTLKVSTSCM